jgi:hypothetical protein
VTHTPLLILTYRCQVKDNFIILPKWSTLTFSIAIQATDNGQNFEKHNQKARFQTVLGLFVICVYTILSQENPFRK